MRERTRRVSGSRRAAGAGVILALMGSLLTAVAAPAFAADPTSVESYALEGTVNLAPEGLVTVSSSQGGASPDVLNDGASGHPELGVWVADDTGVDAGGWVQIDLPRESELSRVVVFPRGDPGFYGVYYPIDFTVSVLDAEGETVAEQRVVHDDSPEAVVTEPDVVDFDEPVTGVAVRIDVTTRQSREGGILQFSEIAAFGVAQEGPDYQPAGTDNLSVTSSVIASSSYEQPGESWAARFAIDGDTGRTSGWSTDPYARVQDPSTSASLQLQLQCESDLSRVVVFPREKSFPRDYRIEISDDASTWTTVAESLENAPDESEPQVFDLAEEPSARYVRLFVDTRNGPAGVDGYLVQLAEIAVYGQGASCVNQVKPALLLEPGTSDDTWFADTTEDAVYEVSSSAPEVATVAADGTITAVAPGQATITLVAGEATLTVPVEVAADVERIGDDFAITVFWAPLPEYVNDEQYDYLAEAGIDIVQASQLTATREVNLEMARLSHERGMQTIVQDQAATGSFTTWSEQEAGEWAQSYTNVPGVGGFYLIDEPADATQYATAFNGIRDAAPEYYPHLNFFPYGYYGGADQSDAAMRAWLDATAPHAIDEPDYLMYDLYPFLIEGTNFEGLFTNLDTVREVGLEYDIKTAMYLQSVGIPGAYRRTNPTEITYEANLAMAYGYKQLSYFTWWTPTDRGEPFTDAIMTADGQPTDLYAPVQELNAQIHALGPTLMRLDALEVYLAGNTHGQRPVPEDFFVQPQSEGDMVLSHMVDRTNGDDYLFVVNNSFTESHAAELAFTDPQTRLQEVSRIDGSLGARVTLAPDADAPAVLERDLQPGEGVLFRIASDDPVDPVDPTDPPTEEPTDPPAEDPTAVPTDPPGEEDTPGGVAGDGPNGELPATGADDSWSLVALAAMVMAGGVLLVRREQVFRRAG
ncbi:discoidin domain-containing protein [Ruania halotolerans]|uniref:discoidin domain-containing protein n=1 Tax=Ruania halotolerans TaxID=2897773 RepID=UPI001E635180|nr:discoidin domain-containing protein [Ruania halotolerans]UFU06984.1 discoidin domain-containing protein [Ruania halotolerans]